MCGEIVNQELRVAFITGFAVGEPNRGPIDDQSKAAGVKPSVAQRSKFRDRPKKADEDD